MSEELLEEENTKEPDQDADAVARRAEAAARPYRPGALDRIQEKIISRKLLVFVTATVLMWYGLDPTTWGMIAMCYIGGQSAIDFAKVWKGGPF